MMNIYQVGGCVRDQLLDIKPKDRDWVVVGATAEQMLEQGYKPVGQDFPVFLHPETREEYALARTERKTSEGYTGFEFHASPDITLEQDLLRRDLTINAMAMDDNGNVIDPYGGQRDLQGKVLRHVSPAFVEDPLRVLRVARFAARFGFTIAPETMKLMKQLTASGELSSLTSERVWLELEKALAGKYPSRFILSLRACHALTVLFPELECLFGVPQNADYHPEIDTGLHTLMALNQASRLTDDVMVRFATLVHDLGKGVTPESEWPSHRGHEEAGVSLIQSMCERYRIPKRYRDLAVMVSRHHLNCHRVRELKASTLLKQLTAMDVLRKPERFQQFLLACEADARGRSGFEDKPYPQAEYFQAAAAAMQSAVTEDITAQKLAGEEIARQIQQRRLEAIKKWKSDRTQID